jgi:uncharacterized protein YndB with AHSA1/START domain
MITDNLNSYTKTINAPIEKVWDALTAPEIVKQYFYGTNQQSTYKVGDPITWDGEYKGQKYLDKGEILECEPFGKLSYSYLSSWSGKEDKPENYLLVAYSLLSKETGTELTITFSSYDEGQSKRSEGDWAMIIDELKKVVE